METIDHIRAIEREGTALADATADADLEASVPSCPGWDVAALLRHVGGVHRFWSRIVTERVTARPEIRIEGDDVATDTLESWYRQGLAELLGALRTTEPVVTVWTPRNGGNVAWVARRLAHETAVHRWDAEGAGTHPAAIDPDLASDGLDEFLSEFLPRVRRGAAPLGGTACLQCTDVASSWFVAENADQSLVLTREYAEGSCTLRGPASDLLLTVWGRASPTSIDLIGDASVASRMLKGAG